MALPLVLLTHPLPPEWITALSGRVRLIVGPYEPSGFAPHLLDQDAEVQLSAAGDEEPVGAVRFMHTQGHVGFEFFEETIPQVPRRQILPFAAGKRTVVDGKAHLDGRLIDGDAGQGNRIFRIRDRIADADLVEAGHGDDFSCFRPFHVRPFEARIDGEVGHFAGELGGVLAHHDDVLSAADRS